MQKFAILAVILGNATLSNTMARDVITVEEFTPQGEVSQVEQVHVRFKGATTALGQERSLPSLSPFTSNCEAYGKGRWLNPTEWVFEFSKPLAAKTQCSFQGSGSVVAPSPYQFKVLSSKIVRTIPYGANELGRYTLTPVEPDQIFILGFDHPISNEEIVQRLFFTVERDQSQNRGVEILSTDILKKINREAHEWLDLKNKNQTWVAIRAKLDFPSEPGLTVTLHDRSSTQPLYYITAPAFNVEFSCSREHAQSACSPISDFSLQFNEPVAVSDLKKIKLLGPSGVKTPAPTIQEGISHTNQVSFKGPFKAHASYKIEIPSSLHDMRSRKLSNAATFPLMIKTDGLPVLARFPGTFGILEAQNAVLPVSVRNIEKTLSYSQAPLKQFKSSEDARSILNWLQRVNRQNSRSYGEGEDGDTTGNGRAVDYQSIFKSYAHETQGKISRSTLPIHEGSDSAEVLGIPLPQKGLRIVELESKILGEKLLDQKTPLYSSVAVLVTNLSVHFKRAQAGRSLVWVTELSTGKPVSGASVNVQDCRGKTLAQGTTQNDGTFFTGVLPSEETLRKAGCDYKIYQSTQMVVIAKKGDDFSFALDSWKDGIESWRFNTPRSWSAESTVVAHSVLDRDLLQPGQLVHFKHYIRDFFWNGLKLPPKLPAFLIIRHNGSDQEWQFPISFNPQGIAFSEWKIPTTANLGDYSIFFSFSKASRGKTIENAGLIPSGSFTVQEFRLPTLNLLVKAPLDINASEGASKISLLGTYLSGGPANELPVEVRFMKEKMPSHFRVLGNTLYGQDLPVKTGITDEKDSTSEEENPRKSNEEILAQSKYVQKISLDAGGSAQVSFPKDLLESSQDAEIHSSISYTDPNGEIQTVTRKTSILSRDRYLGIPTATEPFFQSPKNVSYTFSLDDTLGKGIANEPIEVSVFEKTTFAHRTRLLGGFYGYHATQEIRKLGSFCSGKTDASGKLKCSYDFPRTGSFILEARSHDSQGRELIFVQELTIWGNDPNTTDFSESDRMGLATTQEEYEAGETAKIVIQSSFKNYTALITVEREGVLESSVEQLSGDKPMIAVPIKAEYSPNIVVSVMAVRGRIDATAPTGTLDLAKPSFKLGMISLKVGKKSHLLPISVQTPKTIYQIRQMVPVEIKTKPGAELSLAVIDQALLKIKPNTTWDLLDHLIVARNHQVDTSTSQINVIGKRHFGKKATPFGGGGGKMITRELFDSLVAWIPKLKADANGVVKTQFKLNDSISSFAVVAIGSEGLNLFGTAKTQIAATQDIQIISSIPPVLREKDRLPLSFVIRNTTASALKVKSSLEVNGNKLPAQEISVPGQGSQEVKWEYTVPTGTSALSVNIQAIASETAKDSMKLNLKVQKLVPQQVISGVLQQIEDEIKLPIELPQGTLAGEAAVRIQALSRLSTEPESALQYLKDYEYNCLEQQTSKAIGLRDVKAWKKILASLKTYRDPNGLLKFFPQTQYGSLDLTAYFLKMSAIASVDSPQFSIKKEPWFNSLITSLKNGIEGKIKISQSWWPKYVDANERIHALEALSYYESVPVPTYEMVKSLSIPANVDHALSLSQTLVFSQKTLGNLSSDSEKYWNEVLSHYQFENTNLKLKDTGFVFFGPLEASPDGIKARTLTLLLSRDEKENATKLLRSLIQEMKRGSFDTTPANALALNAIRQFQKKYEKTEVSGTFAVQLDQGKKQTQKNFKSALIFPIQNVKDKHTLTQSFQGSGKPWSFTQLEAAIPTVSEIHQGYHVEKKIELIQSKNSGKYSKGDLYKVTLTIEAMSPQSWIVLKDPIPTGASIISSESSEGWVAFEERRMDRMQVFYEYLPQGKTKYTYIARLSQVGSFSLPSTRVEAMYDPTQYGEIPNASMDIHQ